MTFVDHDEAERRAAAGLHDVVLIDHIAVIQIDGYAVADDAGAARHLDDVTDHLGGSCAACRLRVLNVTAQCIDDVGIKPGAFRRYQCGARIPVEVIRHDHAMELVRNDQVGS